LLEVAACGVCRTDLHVVDGELPNPKLPLIPGHEIVGRVAASGADVAGFAVGVRIGVPWLGYTCGVCRFCLQLAGLQALTDNQPARLSAVISTSVVYRTTPGMVEPNCSWTNVRAAPRRLISSGATETAGN
jgi:threonine dehydrogenase-like Zn-dependent dehydrogenase